MKTWTVSERKREKMKRGGREQEWKREPPSSVTRSEKKSRCYITKIIAVNKQNSTKPEWCRNETRKTRDDEINGSSSPPVQQKTAEMKSAEWNAEKKEQENEHQKKRAERDAEKENLREKQCLWKRERQQKIKSIQQQRYSICTEPSRPHYRTAAEKRPERPKTEKINASHAYVPCSSNEQAPVIVPIHPAKQQERHLFCSNGTCSCRKQKRRTFIWFQNRKRSVSTRHPRSSDNPRTAAAAFHRTVGTSGGRQHSASAAQ